MPGFLFQVLDTILAPTIERIQPISTLVDGGIKGFLQWRPQCPCESENVRMEKMADVKSEPGTSIRHKTTFSNSNPHA